MAAPKHANAPPLDKARVLDLLAEHPGATKRDLARLTGLKGSDRIVLKRILQGAGSRRRHRRASQDAASPRRGELPEVAVLEITGMDADGELLARPLNWEANEEPPLIHVMPPKDGAALGPGDAAGAAGKARRRL